ncbi:ATP-binding cassette domain-containing protein, partial [Bacillus thuringiensis]|nr:ATP-binding cassette domain-containing protein [Bacillus thuringiensis]
MIQFNHVSKSYEDGTKAVDSLHLEIKKGEFFVLIGPSGCGKTTTMKMINRLIETTEGSILIDGKDIQQYNINELLTTTACFTLYKSILNFKFSYVFV